MAILISIEYIITSLIYDTYITILSDSISALKNIKNTSKPLEIAMKILLPYLLPNLTVSA